MVVMGQRWLECAEGSKNRRLFDANDWVRREVELGLQEGTGVIPVLVDGAAVPAQDRAYRLKWYESVPNELEKVGPY